MKLERLALISEVVASAAIVITLIVLIFQVRGNTEAVRAAAYQDVADSLTSIPVTIAANRDLARIFNAGLSDSLDDPLDLQQFSLLALMQVRRFENAFHQQGRMDPGLWQGVRNSLGMFAAGPGFGAWWDENRERFSPDFQELIGELRSERVD